MKKKIVFFDIDGTLYYRSDPRKIPESTRMVIRELQESGKRVIVCTGRCLSCIEPYLLEFGFDGFIAGCGTHIIYQKQELSRYAWENSKIKMLDQFCKRQGLIPIFEGSDFLYLDESDCIGGAGEMYRFYDSFYKGKLRPIDYQAEDICKMTIRYISDKETRRSGAEVSNEDNQAMIKKTDLKINIGIDNEAFTSTVSHWDSIQKNKIIQQLKEWGLTALDKGDVLEVFPEGYGKGEGIRKFLELTDQKNAETYAFGDGVNDISMMEQVDYGIAVGDAAEELVKVCYLQTAGVYQDGIYAACQKLRLI